MLKRQSLREQVRDALLAKIGSGELQPGDRVVEAQIASELEVSPIPIREAIRELVAIGVLQAEIHRGAWVREVSLPETIEALEVRSALDVLAVRKAAKRLRGRCEPLRTCVAAIVDAAKRRDFVAFQQHNQSFHRYILEQAGNAALLRVYDSLAFEVRARAIMDFLVSDDPVDIAREHEAIVDAIERGDARQAARCAVRHSEELIRHLRKEAAKRDDEPAPVAKKKKGRQRQRS
ncbi:MAG: GntR family transcriptional regulator [Thermoguttaceae bacterium]|jgi:DNA-binding GntR family transcriptional regulator